VVLPLGIAAAAAAPAAGPGEADARAILESMRKAADGIRDYTMVLVKQERRLEGLEPEQRLLAKWARPHRVYFKALDGDNAGQEVLFVRGWNRDLIRAHKGSFPDLTVNLHPLGSWAMAHTHHPVTETSLGLLVGLVLRGVEEADRRGEGTMRLVGREPLLGRSCFRVELTSPPVGEVDAVRPGETLWDVAKRRGSDMFVLLYRNRDRGWKRPGDVRPGDRVFVPRYYASKVELWIDEETRLPLGLRIYAHDGALYERYEHRDLRVNVGLTDLDFDPANPVYRF
jgi:hypothetical protein